VNELLNRERDMKTPKELYFFIGVLLLAGIAMSAGCDSGEKAVDELTGHRAVKQYQKATKDIKRITDLQRKQDQRFREEEGEEGKSDP
jgi:hypothetical protein